MRLGRKLILTKETYLLLSIICFQYISDPYLCVDLFHVFMYLFVYAFLYLLHLVLFRPLSACVRSISCSPLVHACASVCGAAPPSLRRVCSCRDGWREGWADGKFDRIEVVPPWWTPVDT